MGDRGSLLLLLLLLLQDRGQNYARWLPPIVAGGHLLYGEARELKAQSLQYWTWEYLWSFCRQLKWKVKYWIEALDKSSRFNIDFFFTVRVRHEWGTIVTICTKKETIESSCWSDRGALVVSFHSLRFPLKRGEGRTFTMFTLEDGLPPCICLHADLDLTCRSHQAQETSQRGCDHYENDLA